MTDSAGDRRAAPAHPGPDTHFSWLFRLPVGQARHNRQAPLRVGSGRETRFLPRAGRARVPPSFTPSARLSRSSPTAGRAVPLPLCRSKSTGFSTEEQESPPEGGRIVPLGPMPTPPEGPRDRRGFEMTGTKFNAHQHITDQIIAAIEAGCPPWRKPWTGGARGAALPLRHNGEPYRGINILVLWSVASAKGYVSARWLTFKQAKDLGGAVRKGEKSTTVVKFGTIEREDEDGNLRSVPFTRAYRVFNADQIDALPADYYIAPEPPRDLGTEPDAALDAFFAATGARIDTTDEPRAFYDIRRDRIHMPPIATFHDAGGYYGTLAHEMTHWTGAASRLDRFERFADRKAYAFEELVAEIGNCLLCASLGLTPDCQQSGAYIAGWLAAMKEDNRAIFRAAAEAQKAADFLLAAGQGAQRVAAE